MVSELAEILRYERLRKGLNQEGLAHLAGVSRTTIHHLERGIGHKPQASTLSRIGKALDLDPQVLAASWENNGLPSSPAMVTETVSPASPDLLRLRAEFDWSTNPQVAAMRLESPAAFAGFSSENWDELVSQMGVGGALTPQGVLAAAERIQADNETLKKLKLILQTHLRDSARQLIDALYQSVLVSPGDFNSSAAPFRLDATAPEKGALPAKEK